MPEAGHSGERAAHTRVALRHRIGTLRLELEFELTQPWTILFGPSGSGKTTILRAIAGLIAPESGRIAFVRDGAETAVLDTETGVHVAPHRRGTPLAAQTPALFPHLTVRQNLRYGGGRETAAEVFGIEGLLTKYPSQLSGGEAQRVSLARAAECSGSRLLLLDEPFTGLETALRQVLAGRLQRWQQQSGVPVLSVTHDVAEAFRLGAEVIQVEQGRVVAQGPAAEVLAAERERLLNELRDG